MSLLRARRQPITGMPQVDARLYDSLDIGSPYPASTDIYGARVHGSYGNLQDAVNWQRNQVQNYRNVFSNLQNNIRFQGSGTFTPSAGMFGAAGAGTWGTPLSNPSAGNVGAPGGAAPASAPANPFTTITNVKNPDIQSAVDSILNQARGLSTDPSRNTNVVQTNVKNPEIASRITGAMQRFDQDVNDSRQSFADFTKSFLETTPQMKAAMDQEAEYVGNVYDTGPGGLQAQLKRINDQRRIAQTQGAQRSIGSAMRNNNLSRMLSGDSSYLDQQLMDTVAGVNVNAAREASDLDRSNLLTMADARTRLMGARGNAMDAFTRRMLLPNEARARMGADELGRLGTIGAMDAANTFYNVDNPEMLLARRLGLLQGVSGLDQANNFYGLSRPYDPDTSGMLPVGSARPGSPQVFYPDMGYGSDGGDGQPGQPGFDPRYGTAQYPDWTKHVRAGRRYNPGTGRYDMPMQTGQWTDYPDFPLAGPELHNDFSGYGNPDSSLYYPGYDAGNNAIMGDYYEGNIGANDVLDYYSGEYDW